MSIVIKGVELVGVWRELHDEELYNLYLSLNIRMVKKAEMGGGMQHAGSDASRILVGLREKSFSIFGLNWRKILK
jgi:hypothetical protein